jgi:hypothetical protein
MSILLGCLKQCSLPRGKRELMQESSQSGGRGQAQAAARSSKFSPPKFEEGVTDEGFHEYQGDDRRAGMRFFGDVGDGTDRSRSTTHG